jgi:archaeosortase A (PGF-CTERM-specific)
MLGGLGDALASLGGYAHPLGWLVLALFLVGTALEYHDRESARAVQVGGWLVFALFWLVLIYPWFAIDQSVIRGAGAVAAAPLSVLVAKTLYEGRDSLFTLSRAVALMGVVYAPFVTLKPLRDRLILVVTEHTAWAMNLVGYDPAVVTRLSEAGVDRELTIEKPALENTFVFLGEAPGGITYTIVLACTGIGSMAVIIGLVAAVRAPWQRKLRALALAVPIIYLLNIVRNVFIGVSFGNQYMQLFPDVTMMLFGLENELRVSYIWADRILAQSMSVVAMILILWLVLREVPEVIEPVEDVLFLLTGNEYDLASALDVDIDRPAAGPAD